MKDQLKGIIEELRDIDAGGMVQVYIDQAIEDLECAVSECEE